MLIHYDETTYVPVGNRHKTNGSSTFLKLLILVFHLTLVIHIFYNPKTKSSFRHLKRGIQDFYMNYVSVPADKAANNIVLFCLI